MTFDMLDTSAVLETADCGSLYPIEMHNQDSISRGVDGIRGQTNGLEIASTVQKIVSNAPKWLPFAAEEYKISANIRDHVMVPVIIAPTDLPNRNMVAFPFSELSRWLPSAGMISYETWRGMPTHEEHINRDYTQAKGAIMDVSMQRMYGRKGNLWKILSLCSFDRSKDATLANDILTGVRKNYSMGAMVAQYSCSVCGGLAEVGKGKTLPCGHMHIDQRTAKFKTFDTPQGRVLGHFNAHGIKGFEVSSVGTPAWPSAVTDTDQHIRY